MTDYKLDNEDLLDVEEILSGEPMPLGTRREARIEVLRCLDLEASRGGEALPSDEELAVRLDFTADEVREYLREARERRTAAADLPNWRAAGLVRSTVVLSADVNWSPVSGCPCRACRAARAREDLAAETTPARRISADDRDRLLQEWYENEMRALDPSSFSEFMQAEAPAVRRASSWGGGIEWSTAPDTLDDPF